MADQSILEIIPEEVLEEITLFAVDASFLGPPVVLSMLLRCSRTIFKALNKDSNPHLYAQIFRTKFDVKAAVRRLGGHCASASRLTQELVRRFECLKRLRSAEYPRGTQGDVLDEGFRADLWMAYIMFLESDGNNARQLVQYSRIDRLAFEFVRPGGRLHDGADENEGWTVDSEINALGVWLFWFTDKHRVQSETPAERESILEAFGCFYVGSFKYASIHAPLTSFRIPAATLPPALAFLSTLPLSASPTPPACTVSDHFGLELTLARPLSTPPALLACVARLGGERDMEWKGEKSIRHELDWVRLLTCYNPWIRLPRRVKNKVFTPGMLDGVWEGRWLTIPPDYFQSLLQNATAHENVPTPLQPPIIEVPMQFRLNEYHQHDREDTVNFEDMTTDGIGRGALGAWLPRGTTTVEQQGELRVYNPGKKAPSIYRAFERVQAVLEEELLCDAGLYGGGVWDIILTAETDAELSAAWGHNRYIGRVRDWDGLIVLVREAPPGSGPWVFHGYVQGGQLIGRWRETGTQVDIPGWEGVWTMKKSPSK